MAAYELYTYPGQFLARVIHVTAKYCKVDLTLKAYEFGVTVKDAEYLRCAPIGRAPMLKFGDFSVFESSSIAKFIASMCPGAGVLGKGVYEGASVDQWVVVSQTEIVPRYVQLLYPFFFPDLFKVDEAATARDMTQMERVLGGLDHFLLTRTFLASERITLADIAMACALSPLYENSLVPEFRAKFGNVNRWYMTCMNQREFVDVLGEPKFCETAPTVPKPAPAAAPPAASAASAVPSESAEDAAEAEKKEKVKNPLDLLPKSSFVLDEWKRQYSNSDTRSAALPWFFKNFDPEGFCVYYCNYKYSHELAKTFMAANLITGWFQRLEHLRKYLFGNVHVFGASGEPGSVSISGVWVFRGDKIPPEMIEEATDGECYEWRKMDLNNADDKTLFEDFCAWDGAFKGGSDKPFNQGKTFK